MTRYPDILASVGHTPMVGLPRLSPHERVRLWAKLEDRNPTGSGKDRAALFMIRAAEEAGRLAPGSTIVEATSGNTGVALAMIARRSGYRLLCVMPENTTPERLSLLRCFGADFHFTSAAGGSNEAVATARELAAGRADRILLDQYANGANARAHYETTGPEIVTDLPTITHFVAGLGTTGTLMGAGRFLREKVPGVRVVAAEPAPSERVCGLRNLGEGFVPELFDAPFVDERRPVTAAEARQRVHDLLDAEGILVGASAGAVLHVALQLAAAVAEEAAQDETVSADIALMVMDGGWKYLSQWGYTDRDD